MNASDLCGRRADRSSRFEAQAVRIAGRVRPRVQDIAVLTRDHASVVQRGKESEHGGFGRFIAELDVMFRGVVETAFGSGEFALVEKAFAELAIGHGESFFIPDDPVIVEGLFKRRDRLLPLSFSRLLQRQIVVENAERAIVFRSRSRSNASR